MPFKICQEDFGKIYTCFFYLAIYDLHIGIIV